MKKKIFGALDTDKINEALNITKEIKDYIAGIKLGLEFFSKNGPEGVKAFSYFNIPIFLDLIILVFPCIIFFACIILAPKTCPII